MLELLLCSMFTILPDYLYRRYGQGKRIGKEINLFSVWFELRWGITTCLILTLALITTVFFFHPSTTSAVSVFRTVTLMPERIGRVTEVYVDINDRVTEGQPLFRLDSTAQEAELQAAERRIAEVDAAVVVTRARLAEAEGRITQARGTLRQALDEFGIRVELQERNPSAIADRDVERARVAVETAQGVVDAALASRDALQAQIDFELPAQRASAEAALQEAQVRLDKTLIVAGTDGMVQQFALRPGDIINPMLRPAGLLVPERRQTGLMAGFGQIEARVIRPGMVAEAACVAKPWQIIPMVITEVQPVIAAGQIRATDQLVDMTQVAQVGTITAIMEPIVPGALDDLPQGSVCIANAYTDNHDRLKSEDLGTMQRVALHTIDTVGVIHALLLRIQAVLMPFRALLFHGGH